MKWFFTILTFYLVALLIAPCSDADNSCDSLVAGNSATKVVDHTHNQDQDDLCSPFCNCVCCSVNVRNFDFTHTRIVSPLPVCDDEQNIFRGHILLSNYHGNIWQPPRLNG